MKKAVLVLAVLAVVVGLFTLVTREKTSTEPVPEQVSAQRADGVSVIAPQAKSIPDLVERYRGEQLTSAQQKLVQLGFYPDKSQPITVNQKQK